MQLPGCVDIDGLFVILPKYSDHKEIHSIHYGCSSYFFFLLLLLLLLLLKCSQDQISSTLEEGQYVFCIKKVSFIYRKRREWQRRVARDHVKVKVTCVLQLEIQTTMKYCMV